ncbi:YbhB/YbcL family Raf kinase inhibitor-like protein [Cobetia crustatorum]|uniref:YbhB/YbcL family Raf kinase inhibitor-like protein n=1 Tax=Cobetia crustatorum TaxID=553385 RepID=A0A558HQ64_9GAMM|nr:YbhB/YbcL family Raf kinase inhibitor-like protein [Cobetia crustatorum]TVU71211.1 YbhB/YbcL family Raf kinase inhibitor-like protein [Cobetia crustatorum]
MIRAWSSKLSSNLAGKFSSAWQTRLARGLVVGLGALALAGPLATPALAQGDFTLTSPAFNDDGWLPDDLKCTRDGGDGVTPSLTWRDVPDGTQSLALIMHHYPKGSVEGRDAPSQYWLLWNLPADTRALPRGNPVSLGDEGADKDKKRIGYTPPCSPPGPEGSYHEYTITLYALKVPLEALPDHDDMSVNWDTMTEALQGKVLDSSSITFRN